MRSRSAIGMRPAADAVLLGMLTPGVKQVIVMRVPGGCRMFVVACACQLHHLHQGGVQMIHPMSCIVSVRSQQDVLLVHQNCLGLFHQTGIAGVNVAQENKKRELI